MDKVIVVLALVALIVDFVAVVFKNKTKSEKAKEELEKISEWARYFVHYARQFLSEETGQAKMTFVCEQILSLLAKEGLEYSSEQIHAIVQTEYDNMLLEESIIS